MPINSQIPSQGLHRARVMKTESFISTGTIGVYVDGVDFEETDFNSDGRACIVLTPYGGLNKMGLTMCPPIGAEGYVMFPGGDYTAAPVWMGGALVPAEKNAGLNDQNAIKTLASEYLDPTDILLKTQYTTKSDESTHKSTTNKIENYIQMNESTLTLAKVRQDDFNNFDYERSDVLTQPVNSVSITNSSVIMTLKEKGNDSNKTHTITVDDNGINITFSSTNLNNFIKIDSTGISLNANDKSSISIGTNGIVQIDATTEIDLNGSTDNMCKWSGFNDFVDTYNNHTHGTPDGPSSDCSNKWNNASSARSDKVKCT